MKIIHLNSICILMKQAHKARQMQQVHNRRANNRTAWTAWTARTVRSAGLLGLLAQTAGTARTARVSALVENSFTRWCRLHCFAVLVISQVTLALVAKLTTRWRHLLWLLNQPPVCGTCIVVNLDQKYVKVPQITQKYLKVPISTSKAPQSISTVPRST